MKVRCTHDEEWHDLSPTAMAAVIDAFQAGDLTTVTRPNGGFILSAECILRAFDDPDRITTIRVRYKGNQIIVDGKTL